MENEPEDQIDTSTEATETPLAEDAAEGLPAVGHRDFSEWHGKALIDRDGEKIGKLEDVYFDVETDQPQFGTIKA
jgi:hypothetical protein